MTRRRKEPEVIVRVSYADDPEHVKAAQDILKEGFRRAYLKLMREKQQAE